MRRDAYRWVHLGAIALVAIGLPWSNFLMSFGQLLLAANFLLEGVIKRELGARFRKAFTSPPVLVFLSFYALHALGLLWTDDLRWGLDLCRILAPVVVFAVILQATPPLDRDELRTLLQLGTWSAVAVTLWCGWNVGMFDPAVDYRDLSCFISHIRLALLLCLGVCVFVYYWPAAIWRRAVHAVAIAWSLHFIARLGSIAGATILLLVVLAWGWSRSSHARPAGRWTLRALLLLVPVVVAAYLWSCVRDFHHVEPGVNNAMLEASAGGERYHHDPQNPQRENGWYVWRNIAEGELRRVWTRRSRVPYDGVDGRGGPVVSTLIRYLASLGQTKDSAGMLALEETDIRRIEEGIASVRHGERSALRERIDEVLFELERYHATGDPSGYSLAMRLEFWKAGLAIAREHWLAGVGTGDTPRAFDAQYERMGSRLTPRWRLRAHNEYLTLWISFGAFGFLWCMVAWIWPARRTGAFRHPLFIAWAIAFAISCLTDDTPETQAGATFFALFYCLFVFAGPRDPSNTA